MRMSLAVSKVLEVCKETIEAGCHHAVSGRMKMEKIVVPYFRSA